MTIKASLIDTTGDITSGNRECPPLEGRHALQNEGSDQRDVPSFGAKGFLALHSLDDAFRR